MVNASVRHPQLSHRSGAARQRTPDRHRTPAVATHGADRRGPHDDTWFRVTYQTDARDPKNWDPLSIDPRRNQNFLEVTLKAGWSDTALTGKGSKLLRPDHLIFDPPGKMQQLAVIEVVHVPLAIRFQ